MCGRISLFTDEPTLVERFGATPVRPIRPRYNVAPSSEIPVITNAEPESIDQYRWGLVPSWADDPSIGNRLINARSETVANKPSFRDAFEARRCLVLVDGFYEWQRRPDENQPYRICRSDGEPFTLAGLWETWQNGESLHTTTILTTEPNDLLQPIHDRMPVILAEEDEQRWLSEDETDELHSLFTPASTPDLEAYPVSTAVNDPTNDGPTLVEAIADEGGQSDLGDWA